MLVSAVDRADRAFATRVVDFLVAMVSTSLLVVVTIAARRLRRGDPRAHRPVLAGESPPVLLLDELRIPVTQPRLELRAAVGVADIDLRRADGVGAGNPVGIGDEFSIGEGAGEHQV